MKQLLCVTTLTLCASCALPAVKSPHTARDSAQPTTSLSATPEPSPNNWTAKPVPEARLIARDGTIVSPQQPGTVAVTPRPGKDSTREEGSRWTLLEQYQSAISAKEELEFEVTALGAALDQSEAEAARLSQVVQELQTQLASQAQTIASLKDESLELAARLTTAQVRRLQSEKLLLEGKLEWARVQAALTTPSEPRLDVNPTEAGSGVSTRGQQP